MKVLFFSASLMLSLSAYAQNKGIYGEDNRKDVYETTNPSYLELAKSTAAMVEDWRIFSRKPLFKERYYHIVSSVLNDKYPLCSGERFRFQPTGATCSGFLVSPTKLVTAGHCIKSIEDCEEYRWVFDYKLDSASQKEIRFPVNNVYRCTKILARELNKETKNDYAVVELDRPVLDRTPLKFRQSGKAEVGDELVVIGHPSGLPTKIADGAKVRSTETNYFVSNLDTYGGNSGSAVINVKTEEVEGILVRGGTDYEPNQAKTCLVSARCKDDECKGESSTYITNVPGLKDL